MPTRAIRSRPSHLAAVAVLLACGLGWLAAAPPAPPAAPAVPQQSPATPQQAPAEQPWKVTEERWFEMLLGGKPCGYSRELVETREGLVRSSNESELRLGRMGQGVVVRSRAVFVETAEGKPVEAAVVKETGAAPVRTRWLFNADTLDVVDEQDGHTKARRVPLPDAGWLTPAKAREFVRRRVAGGADSLEYRTLDPEGGPEAVRVQSKRTGAGTYDLAGKRVPTSVWESRNSLMATPSVEELAADGVLVRSRTDLGVGVLEARLSTKERATASKGSVEVMARTFVTLKEDGSRLPSARTATLRLSLDGAVLRDLPSAGSQRFARVDERSGTLEIAVDSPQPAERGEETDARYTRSSVMVDSENPRVRALADQALKGVGDDPMRRVAALRSAVARHLTRKNLASGFATASEAAATRAGDCTEHAVLLAACLRHAGIPSRVASGLLYVPRMEGARNAFGWHMWTQALVNGRWVDADAVLPPDGPLSHAGHILVMTSPAEGSGLDSELARLVEMIGTLRIEVVTVDGQVPGRAAP